MAGLPAENLAVRQRIGPSGFDPSAVVSLPAATALTAPVPCSDKPQEAIMKTVHFKGGHRALLTACGRPVARVTSSERTTDVGCLSCRRSATFNLARESSEPSYVPEAERNELHFPSVHGDYCEDCGDVMTSPCCHVWAVSVRYCLIGGLASPQQHFHSVLGEISGCGLQLAPDVCFCLKCQTGLWPVEARTSP